MMLTLDQAVTADRSVHELRRFAETELAAGRLRDGNELIELANALAALVLYRPGWVGRYRSTSKYCPDCGAAAPSLGHFDDCPRS